MTQVRKRGWAGIYICVLLQFIQFNLKPLITYRGFLLTHNSTHTPSPPKAESISAEGRSVNGQTAIVNEEPAIADWRLQIEVVSGEL
jgi:hypothetical protein